MATRASAEQKQKQKQKQPAEMQKEDENAGSDLEGRTNAITAELTSLFSLYEKREADLNTEAIQVEKQKKVPAQFPFKYLPVAV